MGWASVVGIILQTLGPLAVELVRALVDGDRAALDRVSDIIPETLQTEALAQTERARLRRLESGE